MLTERTGHRLFDGVVVVLVALLSWVAITNADDQSYGSVFSVLAATGIWILCWFWLCLRATLPDDDWKATAYASMPLGLGLGLAAFAATSVFYDLVLRAGGRYMTVWASQVSEYRNKGGRMTYGYDVVRLDGTSLPHRLFTSEAGLTGRITVYDDPGGVAPPLLSNEVELGRHVGFLLLFVALFGVGVVIVVRRTRRAWAITDG